LARFVIDLGDMEISDAAAEELNAELQQVALKHVAGMRPKQPLAFKFPDVFPLGIIIRPDLDLVREAEATLQDALKSLQ